MTFPVSDLSFLFLLGLHLGDGVTVRDGELYLNVAGAGEQPVPAWALDELEGRSWISCDTFPPTVTDKGVYWLTRWAKTKLGKGRIVQMGRNGK